MRNVLMLVLLCCSLSVTGTTYYLDPSGSDSNNGSSSSPWKTLAYACSKANVSGDIIHINAGTYVETAECSVAVGVSIVGAGKTNTIIISHFATSQSNWQPRHGALTFSSTSLTNGNQSVSNLTLDGDNLTGNLAGTTSYVGIMVFQRSNVIIHDCIVKDFWSEGIIFLGTTFNWGTPVADINSPPTYAVGNQIYNCTIDNCTDQADSEQPGSLAMIVIGSQTTMEIHDNILTENSRAQGHNGDIITSGWWEKGVKIYNNIFTKIADDGASFNFHIEMWCTTGGFEVYGNQFYGGDCALNIAGFFNVKGTYAYSWYVHNNYFEGTNLVNSVNSNRVCIVMEDEDFEDVIITRNHFYKYPRVASISNGSVPTSTIKNIEFSYNILEQCGWDNTGDNYWTRLIELGNGNSGNTIDNVLIANNVLQTNSHGQTEAIRIVTTGTTNNVKIRNNIVENSNNGAWLTVTNAGTFTGLYVDNNLLYNNANSNIPTWGGVSHTWNNNIIGSDPLLVSSSDFHLQALSPAIGKGLSVAGLVADYGGSAIKSPPSIGAYESGSTAQTPLPAVPVYQSSVVQNTTPSLLEVTYDLTLNNAIVPAISSFIVKVNSFSRTVNAVTASGTKVKLTLASRIFPDDVVTIAYTKPVTNPIQTASGGTATSISNQQVINNCINTAPTAAITSPTMGSSLTASPNIMINATALDSDGSVSLVEFYSGTTRLGSKSSAPYSFTWTNVASGTYSLTVIATDNLSAKTTSSPVSISVVNGTPTVNQRPIVKILNPSKGIKFEKLSTITIDAIASDPDGSVTKVEFYNGSVRLVELTSAPYSYTWKDVAAGNYSITAIATDNLNDTTISSQVKFAVGSTVKYDANSEIVKLYPNPNNGHFSIEFINPLQNDKSEIIITDLSGRQVYNGPVSKEETLKQIDVSNSRSGIYVMMIKDKDILVTKKFIKN